MTNYTTEKELRDLLENLTYEEIFYLEENLKKLDFKNLLSNKELNDKINQFIEMLSLDQVLEEVYFNNIIKDCYDFMKFGISIDSHLARAFCEFYDLTNENVKELYETADYKDIKYFDAFETFKETKKAKDLMIFMRSFAKTKNIDILRGLMQTNNYYNREQVVDTLIEEANLNEDRFEHPRCDYDFNKLLIKNITGAEQKVVYNLFEIRKIKSIDEFDYLGMTLITV